jgi:XTP/dITP diphosphohydrolase
MTEPVTLLFATNNQHKVDEIQLAIGDKIQVKSLKNAGINIDIPEPHNTLEENAIEKSTTIFALTGTNCFSEDTGLEVSALKGEPGVRSARYADGRSSDENITKLLKNLHGVTDRSARFRTVISLIWKGKQYLFEGVCAGQILEQRHGDGGFGYDPVFIPDGGNKSFGEMTAEEKNYFSHRKKAADQLVLFLQQHG